MSKLKMQNKPLKKSRSKLPVTTLSQIGLCLAFAGILISSLSCSDSETAALDGSAVVGSSSTAHTNLTNEEQLSAMKEMSEMGQMPAMKEMPTMEDMSAMKEMPRMKEMSAMEDMSSMGSTTVGDGAKQEDEGPDTEESEEGGVLKKAGDFFGKAASSSGAAKDWVQDKINGAAGAGGQAADDTMNWANDTFQSLKDKGLTTASDTGEWLSQDWKNSKSWEYKIVTLTGENDEMSEELNKLGKDGWECFHSVGFKFFFKKPHDSYLREMPFKDFIKLAPLLHKATQ